jgi:hypothetical protein
MCQLDWIPMQQPLDKSIQPADSPQWNAPQLIRLGAAHNADKDFFTSEGSGFDFVNQTANFFGPGS